LPKSPVLPKIAEIEKHNLHSTSRGKEDLDWFSILAFAAILAILAISCRCFPRVNYFATPLSA
jgi:hypothetical protein